MSNRASERSSHLIKLLPKSSGTYLDLGSGSGLTTKEIGQLYHFKNVYGSDIFPPPSSNNGGEKEYPVPYLQIIDNKIPLDNNSVDLVTSFMAIHHFDDPSFEISEIRRVLKPGGHLFIREHDVNTPQFVDFLDRMHENIPDHPGGPTNYWSRKNLRDYLYHNGFNYVGSSDYPTNIPNEQAIYHSLFIKI